MGQQAAADPVAQQLRADRTRAVAVDRAMTAMQIDEDAFKITAPEFRQSNAEDRINRLNVLIDNDWLKDIRLSLTRVMGLRPEAAPKLTKVIVDTVFAQPTPPTSVFGFCATKPESNCVKSPLTREEFFEIRGLTEKPLSPALNINRVLFVSKPAGVALGAALADQDKQAALAIKPLDPANAAAELPLCVANDKGVTLNRCIQAGAGHYLARKGISK